MKVFIEISALCTGYFTCIDYGNRFMNFTLGMLQNETPRNIVRIKNYDYRTCAKIQINILGKNVNTAIVIKLQKQH